MNKMMRKITLIIFMCYAFNIGFSILNDWAWYSRTQKEVRTIIQLTARDSAREFQTQDLSGYLAPKGNVNSIRVSHYKDYLYGIKSSSDDNGYTVLSSLCKFLNDDVTDKVSKDKINEMFTPLQFDLTYLDSEGVKDIFHSEVSKLFTYNYDEKYNRLAGRTAELTDVKVSIDGPKIVNFEEATSDLTYAQIFGVNNRQASIDKLRSIASGVDSSKYGELWGDNFNQVIAYTVTYTIDWKYICQSQLFRIPKSWGIVNDNIYKQTGAIMMPAPPTQITIQYVLTN